MSCKAEHATVGAIFGIGAYALYKWAKKEKWTFEGAAAALGFGAAFGLAADLLEPAKHPNHRGVCHSYAALAGLFYGTVKALESPALTSPQRLLALVPSAAYASHLLWDADTPKSLPLLA